MSETEVSPLTSETEDFPLTSETEVSPLTSDARVPSLTSDIDVSSNIGVSSMQNSEVFHQYMRGIKVGIVIKIVWTGIVEYQDLGMDVSAGLSLNSTVEAAVKSKLPVLSLVQISCDKECVKVKVKADLHIV